jgi:hypothetical protein
VSSGRSIIVDRLTSGHNAAWLGNCYGLAACRWSRDLLENRSRHKFAGLDFVHITPHPAFPRLDGANQRVLRFVEMLGRMLVLGRVATANVSATEAKTKVNPRVARLGTVLTHMFIGFSYLDLIKVGAIFWHRFLLGLLMDVSQVLVSSPCAPGAGQQPRRPKFTPQ